MGDFANELQNAVVQRGKGDVADAIGMPDQTDYETLIKIIQVYEKKNPGYLKWHIDTVRKMFSSGQFGRRLAWKGEAEVNEQSRGRLAVDLPADLGRAIETIFPSMFRSKKHLRWFCKKFPGLTISGKPL